LLADCYLVKAHLLTVKMGAVVLSVEHSLFHLSCQNKHPLDVMR